jgi:hypothetical protein
MFVTPTFQHLRRKLFPRQHNDLVERSRQRLADHRRGVVETQPHQILLPRSGVPLSPLVPIITSAPPEVRVAALRATEMHHNAAQYNKPLPSKGQPCLPPPRLPSFLLQVVVDT